MVDLIDRYILKRALAALLLIVALVVLLVIGMDLVLRLRMLLGGNLSEDDGNRVLLIIRYYLYSLPTLISPLLPLAMAAAAVMTCIPMLKRGEFTALAASGISLRRATRGLLYLSLVVGAVDFVLSDQLAPRWESRRLAIEDQLGGQARNARIWLMEDTGTVWYANQVILRDNAPPTITDVVAAPAQGLIRAQSLAWENGTWVLLGPMIRSIPDAHGQDQWETLDRLVADGPLALPPTPEALAQRLVSRHAMTSGELLSHGSHLDLSLLASRITRLLIPLAVILMVLPLFVRFINRDHLVVSAIRSLLLGCIPLMIIATGSLSADSSSVHPFVVVGSALALGLAPGLIAFFRWRM